MNNSFKEERHGNLLLFDVTKSQDYLVASDVFMIHAFHVASDVLVVCKWKVSEGTLIVHSHLQRRCMMSRSNALAMKLRIGGGADG